MACSAYSLGFSKGWWYPSGMINERGTEFGLQSLQICMEVSKT